VVIEDRRTNLRRSSAAEVSSRHSLQLSDFKEPVRLLIFSG
jgi:hypothetical protein